MAAPSISGFVIPGSTPARAMAQVQFDLTGGAAPYSNPDDDSIIAVNATITDPLGVVRLPPGGAFSQPCFPAVFYTPTAGTSGHGEGYSSPTTPHWYMRYKFDLPGVWHFTITATDSGGTTTSASQPITIGAIDTSTAAVGGGHLSPWRVRNQFYIGFDAGGWLPMIGMNAGLEDRDYTLDGSAGFSRDLGLLAASGGTVARFIASAYHRNGPELLSSAAQYGGWDNYGLGLGRYSPQLCQRIDDFLALAGAAGISVIFCYNTHGEFSTFSDSRWSDSPYNSANGGPIPSADPAGLLTNATALKYQKMKVRRMVARWLPYPAVGAIEHFNEGGAVGTSFFGGLNTVANHAAFIATMGAYIGSLDSWSHTQWWSELWDPPLGQELVLGLNTDPIAQLATIAGFGLHAYQNGPSVVNDRRHTALDMARSFQLRTGKPIYHMEGGLYRTPSAPEPNFDPTTSALSQIQKDHLLAGTHVRQTAWAGVVGGFIGGWPWWKGSYLDSDASKHRVAGTLPFSSGSTPADLQAAINATPTGGRLVINGGSYTGQFVISRPITLILNGTALHLPTGSSAQVLLSITATDVTIDGTAWTFDGTGNTETFAYAVAPYGADRLIIRNGSITNFVYAAVGILNSHGVLVEKNYIGQIGMGQPNDTNAYAIFFSSDASGLYSNGTAQDNVIEDVPTWMGLNAHETQGGLIWQRNTIRRCRRATWIYPPYQRNNGVQVLANRAESPLPVTYNPDGYTIGLTDGATYDGNFLSSAYEHPADGGEWKAYIRDIGSASTALVRQNTTVG